MRPVDRPRQRRSGTAESFDVAKERLDRSESATARLSRPPSGRAFVRKQSERLVAMPSDLGLGFERVTSEHFARVPSGGGGIARVDSGEGGPTGLRVTFQSLQSYGHTEKSSGSLGEDGYVNGFVGGVYRAVMPRVWSAARYLPTRVEEAAGRLYRHGCIDDCWSFGERLGAGAFSDVRLGESKKDGVKAAIKVVAKGAPDLFCPSSGDCREVVAFCVMERYESIVNCYEVYEDDRFIYIVMELLNGGMLLPRVADRESFYPRYCENDVVTLVRSMVRSLVHLHRLGIAHRDIKPENMLFAYDSKDPTIKITDFGISQTNCHSESVSDMVGTPLYVAPEILLRKPYGCAADMWSLGVIVHILLTGYPPFDDDDLVQLVNKVKHNEARLRGEEWMEVSESARDFVFHLLMRDVDKRLTAEQALAHSWLTTPRPPPFPAPPAPSHVRLQRPKENCAAVSRAEGTKHLVTAQTNLQQFVRRKEFKRRESEHSERNLKLSMLVSLSEGKLQISESAKVLDRYELSVTPDALAANVIEPQVVTAGEGLEEEQVDARRKKKSTKRKKKGAEPDDAGVTSALPPRSAENETANAPKGDGSVGGKRETTVGSTVTREDNELERLEEQGRLRQRRLRIQAELSKKKKKLHSRKVEETAEHTPSVTSDTLSSHTASSAQDQDQNADQNELMLTNSKFSDDSFPLTEAFSSRRDADAQEDMDTIQKARGEMENGHKARGTLLGRRSRQSSQAKQGVKAEKPRYSRAKGVRGLRRQGRPLLTGNKLSG